MKTKIIDSAAHFNDDRTHRYALIRTWDSSLPALLVIGLNPSKADETNDDPTIRRVIRFAQDWGFGRVIMCNLFSFITPYPEKLETHHDNELNDNWLRHFSIYASEILCAWGTWGASKIRAKEVMNVIRSEEFATKKIYALAINKDGSPRHPLYVRSKTIRSPYLFK